MKARLLFCEHCRKILGQYEEVIILDDSGSRVFCEEKCLVAFFFPIQEHFALEERRLRTQLNLTNEPALRWKQDPEPYQVTLEEPDETWEWSSTPNFRTHVFIKKFKREDIEFFCLCLVSMEINHPSYMHYSMLTSSPELLAPWLPQHKADSKKELPLNSPQESTPTRIEKNAEPDESDGIEVELPADTIEEMELLKSELLAQLLELRSPSDIDFESFHLYDKYLSSTLEGPDAMYFLEENKQDSDDAEACHKTFIKVFSEAHVPFYYVCVVQKVFAPKYEASVAKAAELEAQEVEEVLIPILTFPTVDKELVNAFCRGRQIEGPMIS